MRCNGCNELLTTAEEVFNIRNPQPDNREFCQDCQSFLIRGKSIQNFIKEYTGTEEFVTYEDSDLCEKE